MRRVRFILITVVVGILGMVIFSGCGESREQKMKALVEEKYGEEFTILKTWTEPLGSDVTKSEYHATAAPVDNQEAVFEITVTNFKEKTFEDTYPEGKISALFSEKLKEQCASYLGDCYVWGYCLDNTYGNLQQMKEITIDEYKKIFDKPKFLFRAVINTSVYKNEEYADEFEYLQKATAEFNQELGIDGSLIVIFLPDTQFEEYRNQKHIYYKINDSLNQIVKDYPSFEFGFSSKINEWVCWKYSVTSGTNEIIMKDEYISLRKENE